MFDNSPFKETPHYEVARTALLDRFGKESPLELMHKIIDEFSECHALKDSHQREELDGCLAILYCKNNRWDRFQDYLDKLESKGLIADVLLSGFSIVNSKGNLVDPSEFRLLISISADKLVSWGKSWPQSAYSLAERCLENRRYVAEGKNDGLLDSFNKIGKVIADDNLVQQECLKESVEGEVSDDNYEDATPEAVSSRIDAGYQELEYLRIGFPLQAMIAFNELMQTISALPDWRKARISEYARKNDDDPELAEDEFLNASEDLFNSLSGIGMDLVSTGKIDEAIIVVKSLVNLCPNMPINFFDNYTGLVKIQTRIQLLVESINLEGTIESHLMKDFYCSVVNNQKTIEEFPADYKAEILAVQASTWNQYYDGIKNLLNNSDDWESHDIALKDSSYLKSLLSDIDLFLSRKDIVFFRAMNLCEDVSLNDEDLGLFESIAAIYYQTSRMNKILGDDEKAEDFHRKFLLATKIILSQKGPSADEFDGEGLGSFCLNTLEDLIEQDDIPRARELADMFYSSLFLSSSNSSVLMNFDSSSQPDNSQNGFFNDEDDGYEPAFVSDLKERFMIICSSSGFFDIARDVYMDLISGTADEQTNVRFVFLTCLFNNAKVEEH